MSDLDDALIQAAEQFPTKKERRQYALLQAAAVIYVANSPRIGEPEEAVTEALTLLAKIEERT